MVVVLTEDDAGSKKRLMQWLRSRFTNRGRWDMVWDDFWEKVRLDAQLICAIEAWETGTLCGSIRVIEEEEIQNIRAMPIFGATSRYSGPDSMHTNKGLAAGGMEYINPKTGKPCTYAQAVHDGHFTKSGGFVPPKPFLSDALMRNLPYLDYLIDRYIKEELK